MTEIYPLREFTRHERQELRRFEMDGPMLLRLDEIKARDEAVSGDNASTEAING